MKKVDKLEAHAWLGISTRLFGLITTSILTFVLVILFLPILGPFSLFLFAVPIMWGNDAVSENLSPIESLKNGLEDTFNFLEGKEYKKADDLDEILNLANEIYERIDDLDRKITFDYILSSESKKYMIDIQLSINKKSLDYLKNLQMRLQKEINNKTTTLESAKSEVEKNITGTTELNQVSELQRARLDKQIEQFEELQRVLVKV